MRRSNVHTSMKGTNGLMNAYLISREGARAALDFVLPFPSSIPHTKDNVLKRLYSDGLNAYFLRCCLVTQAGTGSVRLGPIQLKRKELWDPLDTCEGKPAGFGCATLLA